MSLLSALGVVFWFGGVLLLVVAALVVFGVAVLWEHDDG